MKKDNDQDVNEEINQEELQGILKSELDDARDYIEQVGEDRAEATEYYLGESPQGQSSIRQIILITSSNKKTPVLKLCMMFLKTHLLERLVL